jgi:hypothetical protein
MKNADFNFSIEIISLIGILIYEKLIQEQPHESSHSYSFDDVAEETHVVLRYE